MSQVKRQMTGSISAAKFPLERAQNKQQQIN